MCLTGTQVVSKVCCYVQTVGNMHNSISIQSTLSSQTLTPTSPCPWLKTCHSNSNQNLVKDSTENVVKHLLPHASPTSQSQVSDVGTLIWFLINLINTFYSKLQDNFGTHSKAALIWIAMVLNLFLRIRVKLCLGRSQDGFIFQDYN